MLYQKYEKRKGAREGGRREEGRERGRKEWSKVGRKDRHNQQDRAQGRKGESLGWWGQKIPQQLGNQA